MLDDNDGKSGYTRLVYGGVLGKVDRLLARKSESLQSFLEENVFKHKMQ